MTSEIELAWAAGFFDGEGSVTVATIRGPRGRPEGYKHLHLRVAQVVREPLIRFADAVEAGHVTGPHKTKHQPRYDWALGGNRKARAVIDKLWPYLSEFKREKITAALNDVAEDERGNPRDHWFTRKRRIIDLAEQGLTPLEIAGVVGLARRTVYYHLQTAGVGGDV